MMEIYFGISTGAKVSDFNTGSRGKTWGISNMNKSHLQYETVFSPVHVIAALILHN